MKVLPVLLFSLIAVSCATYKAAQTYTFENSRTYDLTYDKVWDSVIEWFAVNNTPIKNMEKASGFIATEYGLDAGGYQKYCDCGQSGT